MKRLLIAGALFGTMLLCGSVRADEPNAEVAKAIQDIAARRAAKEEARLRQVEAWSKTEGRERGWAPAGASLNPAPGAPIKVQINK